MKRKPRKPLKPLELGLELLEPFASSATGQRLLKEWARASPQQRRRWVQAQRQATKRADQRRVWCTFRNQIDYLRRYDRRLRLEEKRAAKKLRQAEHLTSKVQHFLRSAQVAVTALSYHMGQVRASMAQMIHQNELTLV